MKALILLALWLVSVPFLLRGAIACARHLSDKCGHPDTALQVWPVWKDGRVAGLDFNCTRCGDGWIEAVRPTAIGRYDKTKQEAGAKRAESRQAARRDVEARGALPPVSGHSDVIAIHGRRALR